MTEALLLTVLGSVAGFVLGLAFSWAITRSIGVPLALAWPSFLWAALLALSCGFLFALFPAAKASRQSPMEALRYE
jgi:ABC-type antimicrobial peptide transport system permease subunit